MNASTFRLQITIPRHLELPEERRRLTRDDFFDWLWAHFSGSGLVGVHEGTLLSEQASEQGLETESWTVDAAEAPRERDWVESQAETVTELYFDSRENAENAAAQLVVFPELKIGRIEEQKAQDWDAEWKASFLGSVDGVKVPPFWRILPPWSNLSVDPQEKILRINPGAGFGTGTHETTQLCLEAFAACQVSGAIKAHPRVLDFGSGSGILAIGAALLGADALGVEIDPLALENAADNAALNPLGTGSVRFAQELSAASGKFDVVIANILRPVLLEFSGQLVERLDAAGTLILSGLIESDVPFVSERYTQLLGRAPVVKALNEWRALVWAGIATE